LGTTARLRTTLVTLSSVAGAGAGAGVGAGVGVGVGALGASPGATSLGAVAELVRTGGGAVSVLGLGAGPVLGALVAVDLVAPVAFVDLAALVDFAASSGCTTRRSPSASARRRIRSAWASSIEAEGLDAPMPSFWASASNSLLVKPSSLESSCTRIFFSAKTFP